MTLINWIVQRAFTDTGITVALFLRDREVNVNGYARKNVDWRIGYALRPGGDGFMRRDGSVATAVTFGPYPEPVEFDRYVLFDGEERVEAIEELTWARMLPNIAWVWTPEFRLGD